MNRKHSLIDGHILYRKQGACADSSKGFPDLGTPTIILQNQVSSWRRKTFKYERFLSINTVCS
jgi:hypothetical protein